MNDRINLTLIIPEYDILQYCEKVTFLEDKINPIITVAKNLWSTGIVSTIQACVEFDGGAVGTEELEKGQSPIVHPFCIFDNYFFEKSKAPLKSELEHQCLDNGVLIIDKSLIKVS